MTIKQNEGRGGGGAKQRYPRVRVSPIESARHKRRREAALARKYRLLQIGELVRRFELANLRGPRSPEELDEWLARNWSHPANPRGAN